MSASAAAVEPASKKVKLDDDQVKVTSIGTHSGTFHADEALAVFLLRLLPEYKDAPVVRTRHLPTLDEQTIVVDVGDVYDHAKKRYDHHYRGFAEVFGHGFNTKLSSAGLVYKHYGQQIIASRLGWDLADPRVEQVWLKVYKEFIEALDAIDNGVSLYPASLGLPAPAYRSRTDLSSRVGHLNPAWNEDGSDRVLDERFQLASTMAGEEFLSRVDYYGKAWLPGSELVRAAVEQRMSVDPSGRIILFEQYAPWKDHYFELEPTLSITSSTEPYYVIYPDSGGSWRVQAIPVAPESFESRKALPEPWRGLRGETLDEKAGVKGCVFTHASGFIGGNQTKEGALEMARKSVDA